MGKRIAAKKGRSRLGMAGSLCGQKENWFTENNISQAVKISSILRRYIALNHLQW